MAVGFPRYRPLVPRVLQFISSSSLLGRSFKQSTGDIDLLTLSSKKSGTTGAHRAEVQFTADRNKKLEDDGDQRGLVNCYRGKEGSAAVKSEGFTAEGLNNTRIKSQTIS